IRVFTTRPDTLYGATYMVLAPEHPLVARITAPERRAAVDDYVAQAARRTERDRISAAADGRKTGVDTGARARHPLTGAAIPIWIADYVVASYGTGAIMAVPAHDDRDFAFAQAMNLPIVRVVSPIPPEPAEATLEEMERLVIAVPPDKPFVEAGYAIHSPAIEGLPTAEAKTRMIAVLEERGVGQGTVTYKLRDWLFSRQRYWGEPFPLAFAPDGTAVPIPEAELPVTLPAVPDYDPSEDGEPPLARAQEWRELPGGLLRETN